MILPSRTALFWLGTVTNLSLHTFLPLTLFHRCGRDRGMAHLWLVIRKSSPAWGLLLLTSHILQITTDASTFTVVFGAFLFGKSLTLCWLTVTRINTILHAIYTQANLLAKNDPIKVMCSIGELYKNAHASDIGLPPITLIQCSRLRHSNQSGLLDPELAAATPLLSNKARVAVVHSHMRWLCWGLSQHGRSCVCRPSSAGEIRNQPDVVAGEETTFWALNNVQQCSNDNNRATH